MSEASGEGDRRVEASGARGPGRAVGGPAPRGLSRGQRAAKRALDVAGAAVGLVLAAPVLAVAYALAARDTGASGVFRQTRVGKDGRPFTIYKLRTMRAGAPGTTVTTAADARITPLGRTLRRYKLDELPQLVNVLRGEMSFVGPRPDVPGFADRLEGDDRVVLSIRPGITGPASLAFRDEEALLAAQDDPEAYNRDVVWPEKVRINRRYIEDYSVLGDVRYILQTALGR